MFQRSITYKMMVKWVLNPKALTTNFLHAVHPVSLLLPAYSISPLFTHIPYLSKLRVINVIAINRQSRRERNCVHVCLLRCPSVQLETRWCLNCAIYTSLWLIRQVFFEVGPCLCTQTNTRLRENNHFGSPTPSVVVPVCSIYQWKNEHIVLLISSFFNGALHLCTTLYMFLIKGHVSATGYLYHRKTVHYL